MEKTVKFIIFMLWMLSAAGCWIYACYIGVNCVLNEELITQSTALYYLVLGWFFYFIGSKFN
jgi:hypothetical protein